MTRKNERRCFLPFWQSERKLAGHVRACLSLLWDSLRAPLGAMWGVLCGHKPLGEVGVAWGWEAWRLT